MGDRVAPLPTIETVPATAPTKRLKRLNANTQSEVMKQSRNDNKRLN